MRVDLHCHSTHSDGTWSVEQILKAAEKKGIKLLCITDHDNFNGSIEAMKLSSKLFSGKLIAGIEISTRIKGKSMHFLAYFPTFDIPSDSKLLTNLLKIQNSRRWRMEEMLKKCIEIGFDVTLEEVLNEASSGTDGTKQPSEILSRPHLARVLVKKGYINSFKDAFDNYLADNKPLHVSRFTLDLRDWVTQVKEQDGILVWAHPLHKHDDNIDSLKDMIKLIDNHDIDGIELIYDYKEKYFVSDEFYTKGSHLLKQFAQTKSLLITAGGDFHGKVGKLGELDLELNMVNKLLSRLNITTMDGK